MLCLRFNRMISAAAAVACVCGSAVSQRAGLGASKGIDIQADIVVNGGSFGAPAAALAAARTNPTAKVLLIEPTDWLGGQATSQGVSAIDNAWHQPAADLMRNNQAKYYPADYLHLLQTLRLRPAGMPGLGMATTGTAWVSREAYDPRSAAWILDQMTTGIPNLTVLKMTVVKKVGTIPVTDEFGSASQITSLTLIQRWPVPRYVAFSKFLSQEFPDWYNPADSADFKKFQIRVTPVNLAKGFVVIDASETGDVIALSRAAYAIGREKTTEAMSESGALPEHDEAGTQSTVFPFCMTGRGAADPEAALQSPWLDFAAYYTGQRDNHFRLDAQGWARVWTYRRLHAAGPVRGDKIAYMGDVSMQNWGPGNDYPYATIYKDKAGVQAELADWKGGLILDNLASAEKHAMAWYFYMKELRTTTWDTQYLWGKHKLNMMGTPHGLAKFPYIRDGRRIVGLSNFRILQRYFVPAGVPGSPTSYRFYDSVGIGDYTCDVHSLLNTSGVRPVVNEPAPFYIPYRALGSANVRNLLAGCKSLAGTFSSNAAYRLHPIEWAVGSAAGTASGLMTRDGKTNMDLLDLPALRELQTEVQRNSPISWAAYDAQPVPPENGDIVLNDLRRLEVNKPFRMEIFHHRAEAARILRNGELLGETSTKANGRLIFDNTLITSSETITFTVECLDKNGTLLNTLSRTIETSAPAIIVDDADAANVSVTGRWATGTAQANKWSKGYRHAPGSGRADAATAVCAFQLPIKQAGLYGVFTWYPQSANRADSTPFTVYYDGGKQHKTIRVDQRVQGGAWVHLGNFPFKGGIPGERVEISNAIANPGTVAVADAIGVSPVDEDSKVGDR